MRISDWSSDVCSSDLVARRGAEPRADRTHRRRHCGGDRLMTDLSLETPPQEVLMQSWGATLFRNLESFPGQLATTPPILSAREEGRRSRKDNVRAARNVARFSEPVRGGLDRKDRK